MLSYNDEDDAVSVVLYGPAPGGMLALLIDRGRPHIVVFPRSRRRSKDRHGVAFVPAGKLLPPRGAWARAKRAALGDRREAFENAALDSGILTPQLNGVWDLIRRKGSRAPSGRARKPRRTITRKPVAEVAS